MHSPHPYALAASARSRIHTQDLGLMDGVNEEIAAMIDGALSDSSAEAPNRWNPAVEADALRLLPGRLGALDRDRVERALQQLVIVVVGALVLEPDRDSRTVAEDRPFRPFLALSVGLGPVFGPPSGALVIAPSAASQAQSIPTTSS